MKWPKLLNKLYVAIAARDSQTQRKLYRKALKKNLKAHAKHKKPSVAQVIVRD